MHSKPCRKPGLPKRLPLDPGPELDRQVIAHHPSFAVHAAVVDVAIAATDTPT